MNYKICKTLNYLKLFISIIALWLIFFQVAPSIGSISTVKPLLDYVEETGIDAGALYYTEIEETGEAELNMRASVAFSHKEQ